MPAGVKFRVRRGSAAQWASAAPTLELGELGLITDTGQMKAGDGATVWSGLPMLTAELVDVPVTAASATLVAATNSGVTTAGGSFTAPAPASSVGVPPQRFAITNRSSAPVTLAVPNPAGTVLSLTVLAGEAVTFRQVTTAGYINESGNKPLARLDERYRSDLEVWARARDHAVGTVDGKYALSGQKLTSVGYTSTTGDTAANMKIVGTGNAARFTSDYAGNTVLGSFSNAPLAGPGSYIGARWSVNPNTYSGSTTAGTANSGTVGLILAASTFATNPAAAPNAGLHLAVNPTNWTFSVIINGSFLTLASGTFATAMPQDGSVAGMCDVFLSRTEDAAYLSFWDGTIRRVGPINNGQLNWDTDYAIAVFELYKANGAAKMPEFTECMADSRRVERVQKARRDYLAAMVTAPFSYAGTLATYVGQGRWYNDTGRALFVQSVRASVGTAPAGASVIVDVNKNGTTIFTTQANRPTIAAGANTVKRTQGASPPDVTMIADGDYLTIDIDQIGSTTAGADLAVDIVLA